MAARQRHAHIVKLLTVAANQQAALHGAKVTHCDVHWTTRIGHDAFQHCQRTLNFSREGSARTRASRQRQSAPGVLVGMHRQRSRLSSFISLEMWCRSIVAPSRISRWNADCGGPAGQEPTHGWQHSLAGNAGTELDVSSCQQLCKAIPWLMYMKNRARDALSVPTVSID